MSGPHQYFGPPSPYGQPTAPARPGNGYGVAALVLGIVAVATAFIPGILFLGFISAVLAVVFGILALRLQDGRGIAGTVLGGFGAVLAITFGLIYAAPSSVSTDADASGLSVSGSTPGTTPSAVAAPEERTAPDVTGLSVAEAAKQLRDAGLNVSAPGADNDDEVASQDPAAGETVSPGDIVRLAPVVPVGTAVTSPADPGTKFSIGDWGELDPDDPDFKIWFDGYNDDFTPADSWSAPDAGNKYVTVNVHVEAVKPGVQAALASYDVALTAPDGSLFDSSWKSGVEDIPSVTLGAGQATSGTIAFEVPVDFQGGVLSFANGTAFVKTN